MSAKQARRVPRSSQVLAAIAYAMVVLAAILAVAASSHVDMADLYMTDFLIAASFATIGLLVSRRPGNEVIGRLFLAIAAIEGLTVAANHYAIVGLTASPQLPGAVWVGWLGYWVVTLVVPAGLFLMLLTRFPDGRPLSRRWSWLATAGLVYSAVFALLEILTIPQMELTSEILLDNPTNVVSAPVAENAWLFGMVFLAAGVVGLALRFRRSSGEERQQIRWFVFAVATTIGSMVVFMLLFFAIGAPEPEPAWFIVGVTVIPALGIGVGVPIACGVAVMRYRLWDLDVVIRKTVLYVTAALMLMVVFAIVAFGAGALVGTTTTSAVVAAALAGFAFWPALRAARRVADRLVYGRRATSYEVLTEFSHRMGEAFATEDVLERMAQILADGTGASHALVWLKVGTELRPAASHPADDEQRPAPVPLLTGELPPMPADHAVVVRDRGELLGALSISMPANDPMNPAKARLVDDLAAQAGLVLRNVRLTTELRARLQDLAASQKRLVSAQDEERRKLERNIHDGAQQQLVALAVKARLARSLTERDPSKAAEMLTQIEAETQSALEDLRDLARGIYPPLLADKGLEAALTAQARKSTTPVHVEAAGLGRFPQDIEAAVYFSCLEVFQNIGKYASATGVSVQLRHEPGRLTFVVTDDGVGFDPASTGYGTGLQGIADRIGAIDGELLVESAPGRGTVVTGSLPVQAARPEPDSGMIPSAVPV